MIKEDIPNYKPLKRLVFHIHLRTGAKGKNPRKTLHTIYHQNTHPTVVNGITINYHITGFPSPAILTWLMGGNGQFSWVRVQQK